MFRDERRDKVWNEIRQSDLRCFAKQLTQAVFAEAAQIAGVVIGCSALNLVNLVWLGIASAIDHTATFSFVLTSTLKFLEDDESFGSSPLGRQKKQCAKRSGKKACKGSKKSKHHPHGNDPTKVSEEAFVQARQRMPLGFWMALLTILARRFQQDHSQHLIFRGYRLLAIDGTAITLPKAPGLRDHYGLPKNGARKKAAPQVRMVMLTLPGVRIPIAYEASPLADSELTLADKLMRHVQGQDLLLMDRGFTSYGLFWRIQERGAYFGTRLKSNIKYKKLKRLGSKDWLVEWTPKDSRSKWRKTCPPSIRLRVIHYQFPGFRASALVTNALDPRRLSREHWIRLAKDSDDKGKFKPGLYHQRWQIETSFCELKVVLNLKSLRSRTPASLEYELAGRVVYYLLIRWLIVLAAEKHGMEPLRISFSNAVREVEQMRGALMNGSPDWVRRVLLPRLLDRIASHTVPLRPGRHYPRPNDTKSKPGSRGNIQLPAKLTSRINTKHKNKKQKTCRQA